MPLWKRCQFFCTTLLPFVWSKFPRYNSQKVSKLTVAGTSANYCSSSVHRTESPQEACDPIHQGQQFLWNPEPWCGRGRNSIRVAYVERNLQRSSRQQHAVRARTEGHGLIRERNAPGDRSRPKNRRKSDAVARMLSLQSDYWPTNVQWFLNTLGKISPRRINWYYFQHQNQMGSPRQMASKIFGFRTKGTDNKIPSGPGDLG